MLDGLFEQLNFLVNAAKVAELFVVHFKVVVVVGVDDFLEFLLFGLEFLKVLFLFPAGLLALVLLVFIHFEQPFKVSFLIGECLYFGGFGLDFCLKGIEFEESRLKFFVE